MGDTECVGDQRNWAAAADNVVLMLGDSPAGGEGHFSSISDEKKKSLKFIFISSSLREQMIAWSSQQTGKIS